MLDSSVTICPDWCDIPAIELYLDQVLIFVDTSVSPIIPGQNKIITSTMVNNYVKHKIISPSEKKKYSRKHISEIIIVTLLKLVLSSTEIKTVLADLKRSLTEPEAVYTAFVTSLRMAMKNDFTSVSSTVPALTAAAIKSLAGKIQFYNILSTTN